MRRLLKIIGVIIVCIVLTACFGIGDNYLKDLSKETNLDITRGDVISEADSHGGFHGDGTKIMVLQFMEPLPEEEMVENEKWYELPLPSELESVVYGKTEGNHTSGPYIGYQSVGIKIPEITNGYYYFKDRYPEAIDPYDYSEVLGRGAFNFTILIYDRDTDLLYICEEDT